MVAVVVRVRQEGVLDANHVVDPDRRILLDQGADLIAREVQLGQSLAEDVQVLDDLDFYRELLSDANWLTVR